jgi:hypothetical protein
MGRFHPKRPDGSRDEQKCQALLRSFQQNEARIRRAIWSMADESEAAWRAFRDAQPSRQKS